MLACESVGACMHVWYCYYSSSIGGYSLWFLQLHVSTYYTYMYIYMYM